MTVYVDNMLRRATVGRLSAQWSHLMADTHEELEAFARQLDLRPEWIQHQGTHREHYDVTKRVRAQALLLGAVSINYPFGTAEVLQRKKQEGSVRRLLDTFADHWHPGAELTPLYAEAASVVRAWRGEA